MNGQHSPNLHPLKAGEILDRAFRLYRAHFWLFIGIAAVVLVPLLVLEILALVININVQFVSLLQSFLVSYFLQGAMIWAASHVYLGQAVSINEAYRQARHYFGPFFGAYLREFSAYIPFYVVIVLLIFAPVGTMGTIVFSIVLLIFIPYVGFLSTRWWVSMPAIMLEDLTGERGLERSWFLTSKDFWRIFLVLLASGLLAYLVVSLPTAIIRYAMTQFGLIRTIGPMLSAVLSQLGTIITTPLTVSILVILYYDLRVRLEGYDLQLEMEFEAANQEPDLSVEEDLPDAE